MKEEVHLFWLDGPNSEAKLPLRRQEVEWWRGREALGSYKSPSEGGLELACHWGSSCHDDGLVLLLVPHSGLSEGPNWLSARSRLWLLKALLSHWLICVSNPYPLSITQPTFPNLIDIFISLWWAFWVGKPILQAHFFF